jgi:hyperosmotically inducible protein
MKFTRTLLLAAMTGLVMVTAGCAVTRGQSTVGAYVDDAAITTKVKAKLLEDKTTGGMSIGVETLNGTVQLSGFAKSSEERTRAEALARDTSGVSQVRNNIVVRQ